MNNNVNVKENFYYHPECMVLLNNNKECPIGDLKVGTEVFTRNGSTKVKEVNVIELENHKKEFCKLSSGLIISPDQHISYDGVWTLPTKIVPKKIIRTPVIISIHLEEYHTLVVNNIETITHNYDIELFNLYKKLYSLNRMRNMKNLHNFKRRNNVKNNKNQIYNIMKCLLVKP